MVTYPNQNLVGIAGQSSKLVSRELKFRYAWSVFNEFLWRAYYVPRFTILQTASDVKHLLHPHKYSLTTYVRVRMHNETKLFVQSHFHFSTILLILSFLDKNNSITIQFGFSSSHSCIQFQNDQSSISKELHNIKMFANRLIH